MIERLHTPPFTGAVEWLNSEPLGPAELRGHAVLVNFWTLTCINWLRQEPYVRAWSRRYRDDGLITVGVHTPEFSIERDTARVRQAIRSREIDYPVAVDNDYAIWSAFTNNYWPALYFIDAEGVIQDQHFGEGRYEQSERTIQRLLGVDRDLIGAEGIGVEASADWQHLRSAETYLGSQRSDRFSTRDAVPFDSRRSYVSPTRLRLNDWSLEGEWTIGRENVGLDRPGGSISYRFHARDAHLVLATRSPDPIPFRVLLDGVAPGRSRGVDVDANGNGLLSDGRLYQLVRQAGPIQDRTVQITFCEAGAEAYVFTFG